MPLMIFRYCKDVVTLALPRAVLGVVEYSRQQLCRAKQRMTIIAHDGPVSSVSFLARYSVMGAAFNSDACFFEH